ncbi:protein-L-isoaspartate(D-aspartate) O-methyltransferase [Aquiflexum sp. LQ15W]|uniref:protein-L-isoaspartate(D-aspartate) O-methyltransferase n=1 Tax=Cognataquiflexum nitidum TaxID=2922272 RepID=UPI001F13DC3B|nr:protein-L-isoaspartate(D-aspartate) O-methyltransferase [Cognataquiflexum nitidum]MCH6200699.1 protein-L-isoaspartate(D-aspartate) O-methyltransferase [Cognataquiflexum nitidum]
MNGKILKSRKIHYSKVKITDIIVMKYLAFLFFFFLPQTDQYKAVKEQMVKNQIAARGIANQTILEAMRKVPRHLLVPEDQREYAYEDLPLPIGEGQTISQPYVVAYMTDLITPKKYMKVLEIGTGSGYQAAILAEIVEEVYTIEIVESLGKRAKKDLDNLGYTNINFRIGDGYLGWKEQGPFDAIIVTAAAEKVPQPLIDQLKEGGKMVIPVGPQGKLQDLLLLEKSNGQIKITNLGPVRFVPFTRK